MSLHLRFRLTRYLTEQVKCWGAAFETDLPPEFIITHHATERMIERFGCNPKNIKKLTVKAWYSPVITPSLEMHQSMRVKHAQFRALQYRSFQGITFVFSIKYNSKLGYSSKTLVTVLPPLKV